jgi:hypothetical protein
VEERVHYDSLSTEEISQGWHYCYHWDGLLIGPGSKEMDSCECRVSKALHKQIRKKNETNNLPPRK